jgi:protein-disulfide isomerase
MTFTDEQEEISLVPTDHALGPADAPVTLVEFGEFECPHCGRAYYQLKGLREKWGDLGVRFVWRHLARDDVHPFSVRAAVAAEAAGAQGLFWEMHDHLFEHQHALEYDDIHKHAAAVGLDVDRFLKDMADPVHLQTVRDHAAEAGRIGVDSTPSFLLNGEPYLGSYTQASLIEAIAAHRA